MDPAEVYLIESDIDSALEKSEKALADLQGRDVESPRDMRSDLVDFFADDGVQQGDDLLWERVSDTIKLRMGEVSLWAGVTGHGKSLLLGQVMAWQLKKHKIMIASFEMRPYQTVGRVISAELRHQTWIPI